MTKNEQDFWLAAGAFKVASRAELWETMEESLSAMMRSYRMTKEERDILSKSTEGVEDERRDTN